MYRAIRTNVVCKTCCPLDKAAIKEREKRIEARRGRIEAKIHGTTELKRETKASPLSVHSDVEHSNPSESSGSDADLSEVDLDPFYASKDGQSDVADPFKESFQKQVEQSHENVSDIMIDGETWITNVKVAAEFREVRRRDREKANRKERFEKLKNEAAESEQMYKDLEETWNIKAEHTLPMELYNKIQEQQKAADRLLEKKEIQIEELKLVMDENDYEFEEYLGYYQKDLMLMGDRIDDHMDQLFASFLQEFTLCEEQVELEQEEMLKQYQEEWETLMDEYEEKEQNSLEDRQQQALNRFGNMGEKYQSVKEEIRDFRRKLEDDYRSQVLLFENYKFASLLNTEKLDYNLEVIRRRELENITMRSSLKRAVLHMRDKYLALQNEFDKIVAVAKRETAQVIKEARRFEGLNITATRGLYHLILTDYKKFMDIWEANEKEARRNLNLLLDTQDFIFDGMLGLKFPKPDVSFLDDRPKEVHCFIHNLNYEEEILKAEQDDPSAWTRKLSISLDASEGGAGSQSSTTIPTSLTALPAVLHPPTKTETLLTGTESLILDWSPTWEILSGQELDTNPTFRRKLMTHLAEIMLDETGFLLEEKLRKLITPMIQKDRALVHFDAVLQALGIRTIPEMQLLARYMLKNCTIMKGIAAKFDDAESPVVESMNVSKDSLDSRMTSDDSLALDAVRMKMIDHIYESRTDERKDEVKDDMLPNIVYCSDYPEYKGEEDEEEEMTVSSTSGPKATEGPEEDEQIHSDGSMETPEGCHRRTLSFNTAESIVMTWYKKVSSTVCHCGELDGVCVCDDIKDEGEAAMDLLPVPPQSMTEKDISDSATIMSLPSTSVATGEFLYIQPNDVLRALAGFLREFNAKTKLDRHTEQEILKLKHAKLRLPNIVEVDKYWRQFVPAVKNLAQDSFWDSLLICFQGYHVILKERNRSVVEVEQLRRQNEELAHLLRSHMQSNPAGHLDINRAILEYC